jgi:hypothetical protein
MFLTAMHLMYKRKKNPQLTLPNELPLELRIPAFEEENQSQPTQSFMTAAPIYNEPKVAMATTTLR